MASEGGDLAARSQVCGGPASGSGDPAAGSEQAEAAADHTDRRASVKHLRSWECRLTLPNPS